MKISVQIIVLGLLLATITVSAQKNKTKPPNIIFILVDDLGYGDIGVFYQNLRKQQANPSEPFMHTPHLDKLANSGAMLTEHYSAAPVCAPSRASLLSGLSQGHAQVRDNQFDKALADDYTLGNMLQKSGYTTAAIGKWGLQGEGEGPHWPAHPLKRGFDYFYGYIKHADGHEHYPKEWIYRKGAKVFENYTDVTNGLDKCYTGDLFTAASKKWIVAEKNKNKNQPFFLYLAYDIPHAVLELPTQAYPAGGGLKGGMQWTGQPGQMISTATGTPDTWVDPQYANAIWDHDKNPSTPQMPWPDTYKRYATCISRIDNAVGDIMQLLTDIGIADNTMVVFTSDNGPSIESYLPKEFAPNSPEFFNSFGPFDGIKRDVWEGGVRVPTIVHWPQKIAPLLQFKSPSAFNDWLPTLAEVAGKQAPAYSDGKSLLPLLTQQVKTQKRKVYVEYFVGGKTPGFDEFTAAHQNRIRNQMQMIRIGDTVAIRYNIQTSNDDFELYHVMQDPKQVNNLASNGRLAKQQAEFKAAVLQMRRPNESAKRPYDSAYMPSVSSPINFSYWSYFAGKFDWLPVTDNLTPNGHKGKGSLGAFSELRQLYSKPKNDGVMFTEGFIEVPTDAAYTFTLNSSFGVVFKLHHALIFNTDYNNIEKQTETVMLQAGKHPYRLYYACKKGKLPNIKISWKQVGSNVVHKM